MVASRVRAAGKEAPPVSRAFSYIRFSSRKQQKGESFRRQSEAADEVCRENGGVLDETLTLSDLGGSAFRGANAKVGALAEFLEAIRIGRILRGVGPDRGSHRLPLPEQGRRGAASGHLHPHADDVRPSRSGPAEGQSDAQGRTASSPSERRRGWMGYCRKCGKATS